MLPFAPPIQAAPHLRCEITYGGDTQTVEATPQRDPYGVQAHDIAGRFRFKAVMVGNAGLVDYIKLYVYYQSDSQPVLLHEARYLPPFGAGVGPYALTGLNFIYAPGLGYELQYGCAFAEGHA